MLVQKIVTNNNSKVDFYYYFTHSQVESVCLLDAHNNNHIKIHLSLNINMFWNSLTIIIIIVSFIYTSFGWLLYRKTKKKKKIIKMATLWIYIGFREYIVWKQGNQLKHIEAHFFFARLAYWVGLTYSQSCVNLNRTDLPNWIKCELFLDIFINFTKF